MYSTFLESLGDRAYDGPMCVENRILEMYTSSTDDQSQNRIATEFKKLNSKIRVLVATEAFGMGIQIPDIGLVVNWGAPKSIMSYWQEIGRCARDGNSGYSAMFAYPNSLKSQCCDDDVQELAKLNESCFRRVILKKFFVDGMDIAGAFQQQDVCDNQCLYVCECPFCVCCSYCRSKCTCPMKLSDPLALFL